MFLEIALKLSLRQTANTVSPASNSDRLLETLSTGYLKPYGVFSVLAIIFLVINVNKNVDICYAIL
jgi:hypothetical protein